MTAWLRNFIKRGSAQGSCSTRRGRANGVDCCSGLAEGPPRDYAALDPSEVAGAPVGLEAICSQDFRDGASLRQPYFAHKNPPRRQQPTEICSDRSISSKTVCAAIEGPGGIIKGYLGRQIGQR